MMNVALKEVLEHNYAIMESVDFDQSNAVGLITFEAEGLIIWDPSTDPSGRFDVDPIVQYGEEKIQHMIEEFQKIKNK